MSATQARFMDAMGQRLALTWRHDEDTQLLLLDQRPRRRPAMSATQPRSMDALEQRLAFTWRHDDDLPVAEMALRLGRSASAVARVRDAGQVH